MDMNQKNITADVINKLVWESPEAYAEIRGGNKFPNLSGMTYFYPYMNGTLVITHVEGLPTSSNATCGGRIFGYHIHEGGACSGNSEDEFAKAGGHYNPDNCEHPYHKGDMPVLFGNDGMAWTAFYTDRFMPYEVVGRTVIIHDMPDDFHTQPSGDSGMKIACGVIYGVGMPRSISATSTPGSGRIRYC